MKHPDFDKAFAPTPEIVRLSMEAAFRKGEKAMKLRHKITAMISAAAVLAIACGVFALALPNEPKPDVVSQPHLSETLASEEATVYYTAKGNYYHFIEDCSGMEGAKPHSLTEAQADGKRACPVCVSDAETYGGSITMDANGEILHLESRPMPTEAPYDANATLPPRVTAAPTPSPIPVEEDFFHGSEAAEEQIVYYNDNGQYYHFYMHCSGMMGAKYHTLTEAKQAGKPACPVCVPDEVDGNLAYYTDDPSHPDPEEPFYPTDAVPNDVEITPAKLGSDIFLNVFGAYLFDTFEDFEYISTNACGINSTDGVLTEEIEFCFAQDGWQFAPVTVSIERKDEVMLSGNVVLFPQMEFDWKRFYENASPWFHSAADAASDMIFNMDEAAFEEMLIDQVWVGFDSENKPSVCEMSISTPDGYYSISLDINGDEASLASMNYNISRA